jgi:tetratricopeptide (TPR) repeat protein
VSNLLIGLLSALVATNQPIALSNFVAQTTGVSLEVTDPNDPVEKAYRKLLDEDDAAQEEVDKWIRDNEAFKEKGAGIPEPAMRAQVLQRLEPVRKAYEEFLQRHPSHARAHLAYGSFLMDLREEEEAVKQMERARELDPKNPAPWNNLANHYGHRGPVKKAFEYYAKAIELNSNESVYYQNLATTVFLFRKDAMEFYGFDEPQVFNRSLELYRSALKLDPGNFVLASDYAQSYYGIRPMRHAEAIQAWEEALKAASNDEEREGVYIHLARIKLDAGRFDEVRNHLNSVTNAVYNVLKNRLVRNLNERENKSQPDGADKTSDGKKSDP